MTRCHRCRGTRHLIEGDGPTVCLPCVDLLAGIANDPHRADDRILTALLERHGDVVRLERIQDEAGATEIHWAWADRWPAAS